MSNDNTTLKQDTKKLVNEAVDEIKAMGGTERDAILRAAKNLKSLTAEELSELSARAAVAGCGGCDPCCAENEKGIDEGY